jgi:hypothetical protein
MTRRRGFFYASVCCLMLIIIACRATPDARATKTVLPLEMLATGGQCFPAPETWTASFISSREQLREMISRCRANRIGAAPKETPAVDFDRFGVLAVEMGEQRSTGYGFDTEKVSAFVSNRMVTVNLACHQPSPGAVTAQMMTAPWIMIRIPLGSYGGIRVVDQDGRLLTEIKF